MSKEAKVGLLLGLAFIVAIAMVLRGVHRSGPAEWDQSLQVAVGNGNDDPVDRSVAQTVQSLSVSVERAAADAEPVSAVTPSSAAPAAAPEELTTPQSQSADAGGAIRYQQELPQAVGPVHAGVAAVERALEKLRQDTSESPVPLVSGAGEVLAGDRRSQLRYVVRDGDSLSTIALKEYGPVQGARWVNVNNIYRANRSVLKSMDHLAVGQKLRIPQLPGRVRRIVPRPSVAQRAAGDVYVVQQGDSLWRIAQRRLGNGARYQEIARLNKDALADADSVYPGMRLRLPGN